MIDVKGIPLISSASTTKPMQAQPQGLNDVEGFTRFYIGGTLSIDEMREWSPQKITNFFEGIARIVGARGKPQ